MAVRKKAGKHRVKKSTKKASVKPSAKSSAKPSKKKAGAKKSKWPVYVSLGVLAAGLLAFGGFYGYKAYKQKKIDYYNNSVYEIQVSTRQKMGEVGSLFKEFEAAPGYAKVLAPKFEEAASVAKRASLALQTLDVPQQYKAGHNKLIAMYDEGSRVYSAISELAGYLSRRDGDVQSLATVIKSLSGQMEEAYNRFERLEIVDEAVGKMESALKKLEQLKNPAETYQDETLANYEKALSNYLKELQEEIANGSTYQIKAALLDINLDFSEKWQNAFSSADKKAIDSYGQKVQHLQALYEEVSF